MPIDLITGVSKANDEYNAQTRGTWIADPADTTLLVDAIPANLPTIITAAYGTEQQTVFSVEAATGDSPSNYALTGVTRLKGANENIPSGTALTCLNHEEFFNQYEEKINEAITEINTALEVVDDLEAIVQGGFITATDEATITLDWADGVNRKFRVTLGGNRTLAFSNVKVGQAIILRVTQDATGGRTLTFPGSITWQEGAEPDQAETLNTTDIYGFICTDDTTSAETYDGVVIATEMANPA